MATIDRVQAVFKCGPGGGTVIMRGGPGEAASAYEDASQSWKAGAWLLRDSDGEIEELAVNDTATDPTKILGQAVEDATGTAGEPVLYRPLRPGSILICNVYHGTVGSAVTARNLMDDPHFNFTYVARKLHLDIETGVDTGKPMGRIIRILDTLGDTYGRVEVEVIDTIALQG